MSLNYSIKQQATFLEDEFKIKTQTFVFLWDEENKPNTENYSKTSDWFKLLSFCQHKQSFYNENINPYRNYSSWKETEEKGIITVWTFSSFHNIPENIDDYTALKTKIKEHLSLELSTIQKDLSEIQNQHKILLQTRILAASLVEDLNNK